MHYWFTSLASALVVLVVVVVVDVDVQRMLCLFINFNNSGCICLGTTSQSPAACYMFTDRICLMELIVNCCPS